MLEEIISKVLEAHGYKIVERKPSKDRVLLNLYQSSFVIEITESQTFKVQGGPEDKRQNLSELIVEEIKPYIREIAMNILQEGSQKWNEWRRTHGQLDIDFSGLELFKHNFSGCDLKGVNFQNAMLIRSNFENSILNGCHFENARLAHVNFQNANLTFIHAENSVLNHANLEGANLSNARLNRTVRA